MNKVSVAIISFNSECTIKQTLDSILQQTYPLKDIDIVISDDCSSDDSFLIAKAWVKNNKHLFNSLLCHQNEENVGLSRNINQAIKLVNTDWVKPLAADDLLLENCLKNNMKHVELNNLKEGFLFSNLRYFGSKVGLRKNNRKFYELSAQEQYKRQIECGNQLPAPTIFISTIMLSKVNYYSEDMKNVEDYPTWLKLMKNGYSASFVDGEPLVEYRVGESLNHSNANMFSCIILDEYSFYKKNIRCDLPFLLRVSKDIDYVIKLFFYRNLNSNKYKLLYKTARCVNFFKIYYYFVSKFKR